MGIMFMDIFENLWYQFSNVYMVWWYLALVYHGVLLDLPSNSVQGSREEGWQQLYGQFAFEANSQVPKEPPITLLPLMLILLLLLCISSVVAFILYWVLENEIFEQKSAVRM